MGTPKVIRFYDAPYRGVLPDGILCRQELRAIEKLVLARLGRYEGKRSEARPKLETLGAVLGVSKDTALRAIATLERIGLIRVERRNHQHRPSLYQFLDHPWLHEKPIVDSESEPDETPAPRPSKPKRAPKPRPTAPKAEAPKVEQALLPGVPPPPPPEPKPPREPTVDESLLTAFQDCRRRVIAKLPGLEFVPDDTPYGRQIKIIQQLRAACGPESEEQIDLVGAIMNAYLNDAWGAGLTPAYPLGPLQSPKFQQKLLAQVRANAEAAA